MRRTVVGFGLLMAITWAWAQPHLSSSATDKTIQQVKNLPVSSFDSKLPEVSLEFFLNHEMGGNPIRWAITDCGKTTYKKAIDPGFVSPTCVQAEGELKVGGAVTVVVAIKTSEDKLSDEASILSVTITGSTGLVRPVRDLGDLPMELQRQLPIRRHEIRLPIGDC